jgi:hypothetical protein
MAVLMIGLLVTSLMMPQEWLAEADWVRSLGEIVHLRRFWVAAAVGITINVTWHFLVNWMAIFFQEGRSLGMLVGGMVSALPFLAAESACCLWPDWPLCWRSGARRTQNQPGRIASLLASFPFNPSDFPFPWRSPGAWAPSGYEPATGSVSSPS